MEISNRIIPAGWQVREITTRSQAPASDTTWHWDLPRDCRIAALVLTFANAGGTDTLGDVCDAIRIKANGNTFREYNSVTIPFLDDYNDFRPNGKGTADKNWGLTANAGVFWFEEPWRKDVASSEAFGLGTKGLNSLRLEIDGGTLGTTPVFAVYALTTMPGVNTVPGDVRHVRSQLYTAGASGDFVVNDIPINRNISVIHAYNESITHGQLKIGSEVVQPKVPLAAFTQMQTALGLTPISNHMSFCGDMDGRLSSFYPVRAMTTLEGIANSSVELTLTLSASGTVTVVTESIGPIGS